MNATFETTTPVTKSRTMKPAKRKILVVNDDPATRQMLCRLLAGEDFLVLTAASGVEAFDLVKTNKFDLVLLDLSVPVENGWETFGRLSAQNPLLPVVLITDRPNQFFHAVGSGIGALLEKPLNPGRLFDTILNLLQEPAEERLARFIGRPAGFYYSPSGRMPHKKSGG